MKRITEWCNPEDKIMTEWGFIDYFDWMERVVEDVGGSYRIRIKRGTKKIAIFKLGGKK